MFLQSWEMRQAFERGEDYLTIIESIDESTTTSTKHNFIYTKEETVTTRTCYSAPPSCARQSSLENCFAAAFLPKQVESLSEDEWAPIGWGSPLMPREEVKKTPEHVRRAVALQEKKKEEKQKRNSDKHCKPCKGAGRANLPVYLPCRVCQGTGLDPEYVKRKEQMDEKERLERERLREEKKKEEEAKKNRKQSLTSEGEEEQQELSLEDPPSDSALEEPEKDLSSEEEETSDDEDEEEGDNEVISEYLYWNPYARRERRIVPRPACIPPLDFSALQGVVNEAPIFRSRLRDSQQEKEKESN